MSTILSKPRASMSEAKKSIIYTSEVRHICPQTGHFLEKSRPLPEKGYNGVIESLLFYKGTNPFVRSLSIRCRRGKKLSDCQLEAANRWFKGEGK